jgi:Protein of unknown function (DUF1573)
MSNRAKWITVSSCILLLLIGGLATYLFCTPLLSSGKHLIIPDKPVDLGMIYADSHAISQFVIHNGGTEPLNINDVFADCGCTVTSVDKKLLNPGESTWIHINFNSSGYWRGIEKRVFIVSDDNNESMKTVYLTGYVKIGVHAATQWEDMGQAKFGQALVPQKLVIYADPDFPHTKVELTGDITGLTWKVSDWHPDQEAQSCTLSIGSKLITELPGTYARNLQIQVGAKQIPLTVVYQVLPSISATPAIVSIPLNTKIDTDAVVTLNYDSQKVKIETISTSFSTCGVKILSDSIDEAQIIILPTAAEVKKAVDDFDIVHVNYELAASGYKETLNIPVTFTQ